MVERWLQQLETQMMVSLRDVGAEATASYSVTVREDWVLAWPGQIVQACSCVEYTTEVPFYLRDDLLIHASVLILN